MENKWKPTSGVSKQANPYFSDGLTYTNLLACHSNRFDFIHVVIFN